MSYSIKEIIEAKQATNGIPFSKYAEMQGVGKGTAEYKACQKQYDRHCAVMRYAKDVSKGDSGRVRFKASLVNPTKHRMSEVSAPMAGSVAFQVFEAEREIANESFWKSRNPQQPGGRKTPKESGLSEADYILLAKHNGLIPVFPYQVKNDSGNMVYTKETCQQWLKDFTTDILTSRESIKVELPVSDEQGESDKRSKQAAKQRKAA